MVESVVIMQTQLLPDDLIFSAITGALSDLEVYISSRIIVITSKTQFFSCGTYGKKKVSLHSPIDLFVFILQCTIKMLIVLSSVNS